MSDIISEQPLILWSDSRDEDQIAQYSKDTIVYNLLEDIAVLKEELDERPKCKVLRQVLSWTWIIATLLLCAWNYGWRNAAARI